MDVKDKNELLARVAQQCFQMLPPETGWRILLRGAWVEKRGNGGMKRMYASREAAKTAAEGEFKRLYLRQFDEDNDKSSLFQEVVHNSPFFHAGKGVEIRNREEYDNFEKDRARGFRLWMNELYKDKVVEYQEVKAE